LKRDEALGFFEDGRPNKKKNKIYIILSFVDAVSKIDVGDQHVFLSSSAYF